jgi:hypothetical protein
MSSAFNVTQGGTEGEKLEASREVDKGELVTFDSSAHKVLVIHCHALSHQGARKGIPPLPDSAMPAGRSASGLGRVGTRRSCNADPRQIDPRKLSK